MEKGSVITVRTSMITSSAETGMTEDAALLGMFN